MPITIPNDDSSDFDIPWRGLAETLRSWSGQGQLHEALAAVPDDLTGLRWTRRDVERRARRVVFEEIRPDVARWPLSEVAWLDAVPAQSHRTRRLRSSLAAGVDWPATRVLGWPPEQFIVTERSRTADEVMVRTLRWVLDTLSAVAADAASLDPELVGSVSDQLKASAALLRYEPLASARGTRPEADDLLALERSGKPWGAVAAVATRLRDATSSDLLATARRHIAPAEQLRWRLFHLAVFGELLRVFRSIGADVANLRPLSGSNTAGPNFRADTSQGKTWDIWFESSGIWSYYAWQSPYQALTKSSGDGRSAALGADIVLIRPGVQAIVLECKYGQRDYVTRDGYLQAVTYAAELSRYTREPVFGLIVGTTSTVPRSSYVQFPDFRIALTNPRGASKAVRTHLTNS